MTQQSQGKVKDTGASSPIVPSFLWSRPRALQNSEGKADAQRKPVARAVVKLRQVTQAYQRGEGESDKVTTRLLPRRGSSESGL